VQFLALAADYDGTLAEDGGVHQETVEALILLKNSGRKLILVTGRELPSLIEAFPQVDVFDRVVAENGAVLFDTVSEQEEVIGDPPSADLVARLATLKVSPLSIGHSIIATLEPNEAVVLEAIRDLGLELHIVFNKGAVMILPANINKATGLAATLARMKLAFHNVVGIGDAENDHAFLQACGCAVAVENALPAVKEKAHLVVGPQGTGVRDLARLIIDTDLQDLRDVARARC
jgi:hydroxymethylpyrimidine pyrophosphatase-like HAD family hydrolase